MADPTNAEVISAIKDLKAALVYPQPEPGKPPNVSQLKEHLIAVSPYVVTTYYMDNMFTAGYFKKIDDMHQELTKAKKTEWLEAMGLGSFAAAVEKWHENNVWWPAYLLSGFISLAIPAFLLALALNFKNLQRGLQTAIIDRLARRFPRLENKVIAGGAGGIIPRLQDRTVVNDREAAAGGGMAAIPRDANFDGLREQLTNLNPHLKEFNRHAPSFNEAFRKLPKVSAVEKAATAIKKIAEAVAGVDYQSMPLVARGMGKINGAVKNSDPKKTTKFAGAIGKLKLAMDGLEVDKVPKAGTLGQAADNAKRLADNTGTLATKMREFARTVSDINQELGAGSPA
ncbi:hypothetical protein ACF06X_16950 [Streptomyces sp. NPDC015346]|uniref:hypothetical protein n=1 Tax=Streptomyces sp. NPDC015346 TaxID=3364954 RepID=UPI0036FAC692